MMRPIRAILWTLLLLTATGLHAQSSKKVSWKILNPTLTGVPGQTVELKVQATIESGWHMYTLAKYVGDNIPQSTEVTIGEKNFFTINGRVKESKSISTYDSGGFDMRVHYWEGSATITIPVKIGAKVPVGKAGGWVNLYYMTCNISVCQPASETKLTFDVDVKADTAKSAFNADSARKADSILALATKQSADTTPAKMEDTATSSAAVTPSDTVAALQQNVTPKTGGDYARTGSQSEIDEARKKGLGAYLWLSVLMGLGALVTPCVFPMIPITVSFFTKRPQTTRGRTIRDAGFYSLGIILTFTALGFIMTLAMGATGITDFATNPFVNIAIAAIFVTLALNLFGMFEIQLSTSMLNRLNKRTEGEGVTSVILMGLVFSLTSFTCTVPFVGNLLVSAAKGDILWPLMGTAVFAAVFSAPFFILALFPALMKSLPKSGGWLNSVKVVMGFIEVGAAIKFLSNADIVLSWGVFNREMFLSIWIAIAVLITVYLLGRFQLPHDTPVDKVGPLRVLFAIGFLAVGFWLLTGLFGGRLGELEAQLPIPVEGAGMSRLSVVQQKSGGGEERGKPEVKWVEDNYEEALAQSKSTGKPIFIDFTGYNCTNCRLMERIIFPQQDVADLMKHYVLVRLHTDGRQDWSKKYQKMLLERFNTVALPYYAIYTPEESFVAKFEGMTREPQQFVEFLQKGLSAGKVASR